LFFSPAFLLIHVVLLAGACGIPAAPYLPPVPPESVVLPIALDPFYAFSIPNPAAINPEIFEGFEIYYKLFDLLSVGDKLNTSGDISLSLPVTVTSIQRAGYVRLAASTEVPTALPSYPLIRLSEADMDDEDLTIRLEFSNIDARPRSTYGDVKFYRTLKATDGTRDLKSFDPDNFFEVDDSDIPSGFNLAENIRVVIALYVFSYGNDYLNLSFNIHSTGVYLGCSGLALVPIPQ